MAADENSKALACEQALAQEYAAVTGREPPAGATLEQLQQLHFDGQAAALCLSGGGIRSASFGLGVMQGLARRGLLKRFQYLSTVSGGGYIGSFVAAWAYRAERGIREVEEELAAARPAPARAPREGEPEANSPVSWVRRYSSYLAPRAGITSLDTWTLFATYLRNLALNWIVLLPLIAAAVCVPFVAKALVIDIVAPAWGPVLYAFGLGMSLFGLFVMRWRTYSTGSVGVARLHERVDRVVVPLVLAGAVLMTMARQAGSALSLDDSFRRYDADWVLVTVGLSLFFGAGFVLADFLGPPRRSRWDRLVLAAAYFATAILSGAVVAAWLHFFPWDGVLAAGFWRDMAMLLAGPPAWLLLLLLPEVVFLALTGSLSDDHDREWWARVAAYVMRAAAAWLAAGALAFLGARLFGVLGELDDLRDYLGEGRLPGIASALAALAGAFLARRVFVRAAGGNGEAPGAAARQNAGFLLNAGGLALIAVILAGFAYYIDRFIGWARSFEVTEFLADTERRALLWLTAPLAAELALAAFFALFAAGFGWAVNVNRYSLHAMYRERLIRTFLAATRWARAIPPEIAAAMQPVPEKAAGRLRSFFNRLFGRRGEPPPETWQFTGREADPFTDFNRHDNPLLAWLDPSRRPGAVLAGAGEDPAARPFVRAPLLVVNCALNMVGESDNALQERKAASFTFTPLHAGSARTGYRPIGAYGGADGVTLGTAMTISGAAVAPNAGQRSSPALTFLMTLFNARLGWWLGNPEDAAASPKNGPVQSLGPLVNELLGRTHSAGKWVYLSDGGHFENLGLYEMVRRGCRYIVVVDASADPERGFEDLGNAIRKVRIDLGVEIRENETFQVGGRDLGEDGRYAALFDIEYRRGAEAYGQLLYVKTAIYKGNPLAAPLDVMEYASRSPQFPHEPTSDQFFMETQLESYRALGEHEITQVMLDYAEHVPGIFTGAVEHIRAPYEDDVEN